jgi:hypothetical protein
MEEENAAALRWDCAEGEDRHRQTTTVRKKKTMKKERLSKIEMSDVIYSFMGK